MQPNQQKPNANPDNFLQRTKKFIFKAGSKLGPGFLTGASDDDPSGIGTYSVAGAKYGLKMAWLVPFQLPLMYFIQEMCGRIALVSRKGLAANMKQFFPRWVVYCAVALLAFANTVNIAADISIMAASAQMMLGLPTALWAILITIVMTLMTIFIPYKRYSKILLWFTLFLLAYAITALLITKNWGEVIITSIIPHFEWTVDYLMVATGFIGTTISPYLFFWQTSQEIEEIHVAETEHATTQTIQQRLKTMRSDTFIGMFFSQLISFFIVVTCCYALHLNGITDINSASDAALALKPLAGNWAFLLFSIGIVGAGFIGVPVLAGSTAYAIAELYNAKNSLSFTYREAPLFYTMITLSMVGGLLINFWMTNPIQALLYAAVINGICAVPFIAFIIILANKVEVIGEHKNSMLSNIGGGITFGLMFISALLLIYMFPNS